MPESSARPGPAVMIRPLLLTKSPPPRMLMPLLVLIFTAALLPPVQSELSLGSPPQSAVIAGRGGRSLDAAAQALIVRSPSPSARPKNDGVARSTQANTTLVEPL